MHDNGSGLEKLISLAIEQQSDTLLFKCRSELALQSSRTELARFDQQVVVKQNNVDCTLRLLLTCFETLVLEPARLESRPEALATPNLFSKSRLLRLLLESVFSQNVHVPCDLEAIRDMRTSLALIVLQILDQPLLLIDYLQAKSLLPKDPACKDAEEGMRLVDPTRPIVLLQVPQVQYLQHRPRLIS